MNGYECILADPPWAYNSRADHKTRFRGGIWGHYAPMKDEEILNLPVGQIAAQDAVLFMWATMPRLPLALQVIERWGFEYKTCGFTWVKLNPVNKQPFFGVGYYTKSNAELCLLATRGRVLKPAVNTVSQIVMAERREHSRKPDEVIDRIDLMYPNLKKIELFCRHPRSGWDCLGNGIDGGDIRDSLHDLLRDKTGELCTIDNGLTLEAQPCFAEISTQYFCDQCQNKFEYNWKEIVTPYKRFCSANCGYKWRKDNGVDVEMDGIFDKDGERYIYDFCRNSIFWTDISKEQAKSLMRRC